MGNTAATLSRSTRERHCVGLGLSPVPSTRESDASLPLCYAPPLKTFGGFMEMLRERRRVGREDNGAVRRVYNKLLHTIYPTEERRVGDRNGGERGNTRAARGTGREGERKPKSRNRMNLRE